MRQVLFVGVHAFLDVFVVLADCVSSVKIQWQQGFLLVSKMLNLFEILLGESVAKVIIAVTQLRHLQIEEFVQISVVFLKSMVSALSQ